MILDLIDWKRYYFLTFNQGSSLRVPSKITPSMMVDKESSQISLGKDPLCFNFYTGFTEANENSFKKCEAKSVLCRSAIFYYFIDRSKMYNNEIVPIFSKGLRSKKDKN